MFVHVRCDLCGYDDTKHLLTARDTNYHFPGEFEIVQCKVCGLVYLNPRPDEDTIMAFYPDADYTCFAKHTEHFPLSSKHPTLQIASEYSLKITRLCDVGCGVGDFLKSAQLAGIRVAGIEPQHYARAQANQLLGSDCVFASFETAQFPVDEFDAVTMWHVLEHLPSPRHTLTQIHRILSDDGILSLAVPNFGSLERRIWGANWIAIMAPTHLYHFTEQTLRNLLQTTGFEVLTVQQRPGSISLASNILRSTRSLALSFRHRQNTTLESTLLVSDQEPESTPFRNEPPTIVSTATKKRIRKILVKAVHPVASLIAAMNAGPELLVHARKIPTSSYPRRVNR